MKHGQPVKHTDGGESLDTHGPLTAISTFQGWAFDLLNPDSWVFDLEDIARSLSNLSRFNGHTHFYSVAEHSVRVSAELGLHSYRVQLLGLLHDATEAYLGDVPRPQKSLMAVAGQPFEEFEDTMALSIFQAFGILDLDTHDENWAKVKKADYEVYLEERDERPSPGILANGGMAPDQAYDWFMKTYTDLQGLV